VQNVLNIPLLAQEV